ncbi:ABC transporter ATP-binding protein [Halococcus sp. IIIV-5B]|uniref:ABC transporter ATP-binding protein n=1 Tax=Halococcus sp. IIIV-5B TaxID=2321230 RepID=UPI000E720754|nr:ATP-binding cassette domain-containing protein [Halococcus sp. IIIV-5B]RJT02199.1 ATP-binding cassette domain-containing protein [Halococcus sp. IIIV-5B]
MARIELNGITKTFAEGSDEIVAVDDVDLTVEDDEFLIMVGPSGSGKSTLLRMIAGLERQTEGEITIDGEPIGDLEPGERNIAMVFQNYALYPNMSVKGNMSFGLKMSTDLSDDEIDTRVEDAAQTMNIGHMLDSDPSQLSGGEKQRVAIGRATVRDPNAFLMDEPLSNLDAKLRAEMRTEIKRLQRELGVTTVYVTHNQTEAMTMGDRLAILNDGKLQQVGTPLECFYRPANTFVAGFVGSPSMNFFEVTLDSDRLTADGISYDVDPDATEGIDDGTELLFGVRPEDIELREEGDSPDDFECVVDVVEPMGSRKYVYFTRPEGESESDETFVAEVDGQLPIESGETWFVHVPKDTFYLFERASGEAVHHRRLLERTEQELLSKIEGQNTETADT